MNKYTLRRVLLAIHISGIVMMAGTTLIDCVTFNTFWELADLGDSRAIGLVPLMSKYALFIRVGATSIILTGIVMYFLKDTALWKDLRFRIKMCLVILLVANGTLVGNEQGSRFRKVVVANPSGFMEQTLEIKQKLALFYPAQLSLFFLIVLLSTIRFTNATEG